MANGNPLTKSGLVGLLVLGLSAVSNSPALAQVDLSGHWMPLIHEDAGDRGTGPRNGDYGGLPLNDANRLRADTWAPDMVDVAEWVCRPHPGYYGYYAAPARLDIWSEVDKTTQQVIAWHTHLYYHEQEQTIWMDGRPHPPAYALHTWEGFATGQWEGAALVVTLTHLKEAYIRRSGPARSDEATSRIRFSRYGNYLTATVIIYDPVYLTEPLIRTHTWVYDPTSKMTPWPCEEATETVVPRGQVPSFLPGKNPLLPEFAAQYGIPAEATRGGAETMYPEYIAKMKRMPKPPRTVGAPPDDASPVLLEN